MQIVVLGRAARNSSNIKNRQPLSKVMVSAKFGATLSEELLSIARDELNVKEISLTDNASGYITYKLKPQLKTLGPKYGKLLGGIRSFLETCDSAEVVAAVKDGGVYKTEINGQLVEFSKDDLLISSESAEGFVSASDDGMTVVLDVHLTPELLDEGKTREIISKIQTMRKEAGFEVTDRIIIGYEASGDAKRVLEQYNKEITSSVLAGEMKEGTDADGFTRELDINGEKVVLSVKKIK